MKISYNIILLLVCSCTLQASAQQNQKPTDFLPKGYIVFEQMNGDLNKDGLNDIVLIIKATNKNKIIKDEAKKLLDRNRRGIIVLFKKKNGYELATKNLNCFSSENEDGGVYFAPELAVQIKKGNLYINYNHGRYGFWSYTFKYQNANFALIGYDNSDNQGPIVNSTTSINFLTKTKITKTNTNNNTAEAGEEIFTTSLKNIKVPMLLKLAAISNFTELDILSYY